MYMYIYGLYIPGALSRKGAGACEPVAVSAHAAQLRRMRGVACTSAASWLQPRGPCGPGEGRLAKDVWRGTAGEGRLVRDGWRRTSGEGRLAKDVWRGTAGEGRLARDGWRRTSRRTGAAGWRRTSGAAGKSPRSAHAYGPVQADPGCVAALSCH
jgi:hypothetical protein